MILKMHSHVTTLLLRLLLPFESQKETGPSRFVLSQLDDVSGQLLFCNGPIIEPH